MRQRILAQGAKLVVHGKVWNDADVLARKMLADQQGAVYIHPFDHPDLWLGTTEQLDAFSFTHLIVRSLYHHHRGGLAQALPRGQA
jgi:hypothetical protein